jgi:ATP-dependent DNA helicase RecG
VSASFLDRPLEGERGIGPARAARLAALGLATARDVLLHVPVAYREWGPRIPIASLREGDDAHVVGRVVSTRRLGWRRRRRAAEAVIEDATGRIACVWFQVAWLADAVAKGAWLRAHGRVARRAEVLQLVHPEFETLESEPPPGEPPAAPRAAHRVAPGVSERAIRRLLEGALARLEEAGFRDPMPPERLHALGLPPLERALRAAHFPASLAEAEEARRRLAFDELLLLQARFGEARGPSPLALAPETSSYAGPREAGASRPPAAPRAALVARYIEALPFRPTRGQQDALGAILDDLAAARPMNRLLMGDVGCGKTAVFVAALLRVVEAGAQGALLAPTEILARQHADRLAADLAPLGVRAALLLGTTPAAERAATLAALAAGEIDVLVGTHALLRAEVRFRRLGLGVIDEQQRFGVAQRARLRAKGPAAAEPALANLLVATATPIPRTLAMALYGDLDVTAIRERPPGRVPIETRAYPEERRREGYAFLRDLLRAGGQAYLVFPLVEEGDDPGIVSVERAYDALRRGYLRDIPMALVHGAQREADRRRAMEAFLAGEVRLLLGTSVVEVGVDNPRAVAIGIEHAERFGLAALHQLRGRVGRGTEASHCLLFPRGTLTAKAEERMRALLETTDGFEIAERDLTLRGPGEMAGIRQSGFLETDVADLARDEALLEAARVEARTLAEGDTRGDGSTRATLAALRSWWGDRAEAPTVEPAARYGDVP